jgi:hypothetical protein
MRDTAAEKAEALGGKVGGKVSAKTAEYKGAAKETRDAVENSKFGGGRAAKAAGAAAFVGRAAADAGRSTVSGVRKANAVKKRAVNKIATSPRLRTATRVGAAGAIFAATGGLAIPALAGGVLAGRVASKSQQRLARSDQRRSQAQTAAQRYGDVGRSSTDGSPSSDALHDARTQGRREGYKARGDLDERDGTGPAQQRSRRTVVPRNKSESEPEPSPADNPF